MPKILLPVLLAQGAWVGWRALKLPEAQGPRKGVVGVGKGPRLRLLILGDSSAAGVGVETQDQALLGQVLARLSPRFEVHYQLLAKTGDRTSEGLARLPDVDPCDVAITVFGVNDITKGCSSAHWRAFQSDLLDRLVAEKGAQQVIVSPIPPIAEFPLLPKLLRSVAGARADLFQQELDAIIHDRPAVQGVTFDLPMDPALMAKDGYHPGPRVYQVWGNAVAEAIISRWFDKAEQND